MPDNLDHFCRHLIGASRAFPLVDAFSFGSASKSSELMSGFYERCRSSFHPYFPLSLTTVPPLCSLTYLMQYEDTNFKHVSYFGVKFWSEMEAAEMFAL
jgi:hypothetical protein